MSTSTDTSKKSLWPLRRVTHAVIDERTGALKEKLECGHIIGRKQDIFGYTNAARRRCRYCAREAAAK
jgi:hypothetical protein